MQSNWIDQPSQLLGLCQTLNQQIADFSPQNDAEKLPMAVDTEFQRTNTYYPIPGLIQIATSENHIYLIDPTCFSKDELQPLGDQMLHPQRELLMHSAGEDLEIFLGLWDRLPPHLFDTQIAAGFVGFDRQAGLQRLLLETLGVELSKEETRSDWLRRPLSDSQLLYAAEDVRHLFKLADLLKSKLEELGRMSWSEEECGSLVAKALNKPADHELYLGFGSGWKFSPPQQAALRHLAQWREQTARNQNIPRTFIAKDPGLYGLVEKKPRHKGQLSDAGLQGNQIRKFGDQLIAELQVGLRQPVPDVLIQRPLTKGQQKRYKQLRSWVQNQAEQLNVPQDLLSSKAQLIGYLRARENHTTSTDSPYVGTWREQALQPFLDSKALDTETSAEAD